jgi:hypothetical protein
LGMIRAGDVKLPHWDLVRRWTTRRRACHPHIKNIDWAQKTW